MTVGFGSVLLLVGVFVLVLFRAMGGMNGAVRALQHTSYIESYYLTAFNAAKDFAYTSALGFVDACRRNVDTAGRELARVKALMENEADEAVARQVAEVEARLQAYADVVEAFATALRDEAEVVEKAEGMRAKIFQEMERYGSFEGGNAKDFSESMRAYRTFRTTRDEGAITLSLASLERVVKTCSHLQLAPRTRELLEVFRTLQGRVLGAQRAVDEMQSVGHTVMLRLASATDFLAKRYQAEQRETYVFTIVALLVCFLVGGIAVWKIRHGIVGALRETRRDILQCAGGTFA